MILRPRPDAALAFRAEMSAYLRQHQWPGVVTAPEDIARFTRGLFERCASIVDESLDRIGSFDLLTFMLFQHDAWLSVRATLRAGKLDPLLVGWAARMEADALLGIQYLVERTISRDLTGSFDEDRNRGMLWYSRAILAAEFMVRTMMAADYAALVWPGEAGMRIEPDETEVASWTLNDRRSKRHDRHVQRNKDEEEEANRKGPFAALLFPEPLVELYQSLDAPMRSLLGFSLSDATRCIDLLRTSIRPHEDVVRYPAGDVLGLLDRETGVERGALERFVAGLTLTRAALLAEPREVRRSRQAQRLQRRPLVRIAHGGEELLLWTPEALQQAWLWRLQQLSLGDAPQEWLGDGLDGVMEEHLARVNSRWVRDLRAALSATGIEVLPEVKKLVVEGRVIHLQPEPGEIDLLGWDSVSKCIVVLEVKRTRPSYTPLQFQDELKKYVRGNKPYMQQCERKARWVLDNMKIAEAHLKQAGVIPRGAPQCSAILTGIVTKWESYAAVADTVVPVVGALQLLRALEAEHSPLLEMRL